MKMANENAQPMNQSTIKDKINTFKRKRIIHPKMDIVIQELCTIINRPLGNEIIIVLGASGVGKTTLIQEVKKFIINSYLSEFEDDKSILPLLLIELVSPDTGLFNWKDFYIRSLDAMNEPLINKKILYEKNDENRKEARLANHNPRTAPELRRSLENALFYRKPKVFIIDEAQHFSKMATGRRYTDQLDTLKSLSNMTNIPLVLVGTYDLKEFINLNGQLARRTRDIHFPRYDITIQEDFNNYIGIIYGLLGEIPIPVSLDINEHYEYIYERSIGCVGILKDWLTRSFKLALEEDATELKIEHLEKTELSINKISKLLDEVLNGEALFIEKKETIQSVKTRLGLSVKKSSSNITSQKRNVGMRKPIRDKIGGNDNEM